jgi:glycosyltransferase involved in cell wall biosynthesis
MTRDRYRYAVAVFAHNEEYKILSTLNSIINQEDAQNFVCFILNNGSRDRTKEIILDFIKDDDRFQLVQIDLGDKSNAWNYYVYHIAPQAEIFFFMDGDVTITPDAFLRITEQMNRSANTMAIGTFQLNGRNAEDYRALWSQQPGVSGALYALRPSIIETVRALSIRLPIGLVGDDSLVGVLVATDFGRDSEWAMGRIEMCDAAGFYCNPLNPFRLADLRLQYRRMIRYSLRRYQNLIIKKILENEDATCIPATATQLYQRHPDVVKVRWRGPIWTWFDFLAWLRVRDSLSEAKKEKYARI